MVYRVIADLLMVTHFAWIIFMIWGFVLTIRGFFRPAFFDRWLFRTTHLSGILLVAVIESLGKYCPLTIWENSLRTHYDPSTDYPGSFIVGHIENIVYPNVGPLILTIPTIGLALMTLVVFVLRPPAKFRRK